MKKLFTILFSCLSATMTMAQETATIGDVKYLLDEGEATVLVQPSELSGDIVVPSTVTYNGTEYTVNRIMDEAFSGTKITSIVLPNTLVKIGEKLFSGCSNLKTATLPEGMTSLGDSFFRDCSNLITINIPADVTSIGEYCFYNCTSLATVSLPSGLETLSKYCFAECSSLTEIELPNNVKSLGDYCFTRSGLVSITLPNSITTLGEGCFRGCSKLASVTLPTSIIELPNSCFSWCSKLQSITIPNNFTTLGRECFSYCTSLSSVQLSNNLEKIGVCSFSDCEALSSIGLPSSLTAIGNYAFYDCPLVAVTLPSSVTSIGDYSFGNCSSLIKVTCKWEDLNYVETYENAFNDIYSKAELYVPNGTIEQYQSTKPWSTFSYIYEKDGLGTPTEKCATPTIGYEDDKLVFSSSTTGAVYHYTLTDDDVLANGYSSTGSVALVATYNIRAYATADGYLKSDVAEAKLCFVGGAIDAASIDAAKQRGVIIETTNGTVSLSGLSDGETVSLYNTAGIMLSTTKAVAGSAHLSTNSEQGIVIVKIGRDAVKINLK